MFGVVGYGVSHACACATHILTRAETSNLGFAPERTTLYFSAFSRASGLKKILFHESMFRMKVCKKAMVCTWGTKRRAIKSIKHSPLAGVKSLQLPGEHKWPHRNLVIMHFRSRSVHLTCARQIKPWQGRSSDRWNECEIALKMHKPAHVLLISST